MTNTAAVTADEIEDAVTDTTDPVPVTAYSLTYDANGGRIAGETTFVVPDLAQQTGYQADIMVEIMACNDNGAPFFVNESDGRAYDVRRRFHKDKGMLVQLTGERRVRDAF